MDNKAGEIKNLEAKLKTVSADIDSNLIVIAESLINGILLRSTENAASQESVNSFIEKNNISEQFSDAKEIMEKYQECLKKKEKLDQAEKKIEKLDNDIKSVFKKIDDQKKENSKYYIGIAETIFNTFSANEKNRKRFEIYFTDVIRLSQRNFEIEQRLKELETDNEDISIFKKIARAGEKAVLSSKKKFNYSYFATVLRNAGEKMCLDRIYDEETNSDVAGFFEGYKISRTIEDEFNSKIEMLTAEKVNYESAAGEIVEEFNRDAGRYIKNMTAEKNAVLLTLGERIYSLTSDNADANLISDLKIEDSGISVFKNLQDLFKEKKDIASRINIIKKEIELYKIEKGIEENKKMINKKDAKIAELKKNIESIKQNIAALKVRADDIKKEIFK